MFNLKTRFAAVEKEMLAKLERIRATHNHSGTKGELVESEIIRAFLKEYLPRRFEIGFGKVIDSFGNESQQTDVIITNESHPFSFTEDRPGLFFIEGVVGAGEVKSVLTSSSLHDAIQKSIKFKQLRAAMPLWTHTSLVPGSWDFERFHIRRPYFVVAMESELSISTIEDKLLQAAQDNPTPHHGLLDMILIVSRREHLVYVTGEPSKYIVLSASDGEAARGWATFGQQDAVFHWLAWLHVVMPYDMTTSSILQRYMNIEVNTTGSSS
jgi:hypothetical protein